MPPREWSMAKAQFAVIFGERFIRAIGGVMFNRPTTHEIPDSPSAGTRYFRWTIASMPCRQAFRT